VGVRYGFCTLLETGGSPTGVGSASKEGLMSRHVQIPPALGAVALITFAVILPTIGLLVLVMVASFFHSR
jgi:hypothetical protein